MEQHNVEQEETRSSPGATTTSRKRSLMKGDNKEKLETETLDCDVVINKQNDTGTLIRKDNKVPKRSLVPPRQVCRKLFFDDGDDGNSSSSSNSSEDMKSKQMRFSFNADLENLLNISLEENRKRCIEKYNFDPVLEKPLEGKYVWEKVE